jgi:hypothetical protein
VVVRSAILQRRARRLSALALEIEPRVMRSMTQSDAMYLRWCAKHDLPANPFEHETFGVTLQGALTSMRSSRTHDRLTRSPLHGQMEPDSERVVVQDQPAELEGRSTALDSHAMSAAAPGTTVPARPLPALLCVWAW